MSCYYIANATIVPTSVLTDMDMIRDRVNKLVEWVQQGRILDAMHEFYAIDVQMQENQNAPTQGFEANLEREKQFVASIAQIHECRAVETMIDGNKAVIHWILDFTSTSGEHVRLDQLALQDWHDGKIVNERFVYDTAGVKVA